MGHVETNNERTDYVWLIVTVLKTKNTYRLRRHASTLAQNEFAYRFRIRLDKKDWFQRVEEVDLIPVKPPNLPKAEPIELLVEKDTPLKVLDRMKGVTS